MIKHKETIYVFDISNLIHHIVIHHKDIDKILLTRIITFITHFVLIEYYGYICSYQDYNIDKAMFRNYGFKIKDRTLVQTLIDMWERQFFKYATNELSMCGGKEIGVELNGSNLIIRIKV